MKLIMIEKWIPVHKRFDILANMEGELTQINYDGLSTKEIGENLKNETNDTIVVTADNRFMKFVREDSFFTLENTFIHRNGHMKNIQDTTKRKLRYGHNLMHLYDTNEFEF